MALQQRLSTRSRPAFSGFRVGHAAAARPAVRARARGVTVQAMIREWPDKEFIAETLSIFPDEGVANAEQARCLYSNGGYTYLDVRSSLEVEEVGKVKDSVNIPYVICSRVWDPQEQKKVIKKEDNPDFIAQVQRKFPNKDAKLLVACANGSQYSIDALEALDEAGYTNLVGLRGGYTAWFRKWDNKLQRRRFGEYEENYSHDGDSGGIHASGAGFDRVDKIESWRPPAY